MDQSLGEARELLEVVDDSVGAKVLVLQDSLGVVVAKENELDAVDDGGVALVDHEIVEGFTVNNLSLNNISWIHPASLQSHWMTRRDEETTIEFAHVRPTLEGCSSHHTPDCGCFSVQTGNLISFDQVFDEFGGSICHLNGVVTGKASSAVVAVAAVALVVVEVVHLCSEILSTLDLSCGLSGGLTRRNGWLHVVVDVISRIGEVVEHLTAEVLEHLLPEVSFALHLKRLDQVPQLVLAPLLHVFLLDQHSQYLPVYGVNEPRNEVAAVVEAFEILNELLSLLVQSFYVVGLELCQDLLEQFDGVEPQLVVQVILDLTFLNFYFVAHRELQLAFVDG